MSNPTTSTITIAATADDVRAVLFDIANFPTWSTSFKAVTVLASNGDGRPTQAKLTVDAGALICWIHSRSMARAIASSRLTW